MARFLLRLALSRVRGMGDVLKVLEAVEDRLKGDGPSSLLEDVRLMADMVREVVKGRYRMERKTLFTLTAALLYFLIPTDAIFDMVPIVGYLDDAAVLTYVLKTLADEVDRFKRTYRPD